MFDLLPAERSTRWPDESLRKAGRRHAVKYAYLQRATQTPGFWHSAQSCNSYMAAFQSMNRLRADYATMLPELQEGQSWEFRVGRDTEVAQEEPELAYQTSGVGSFLVMARVAPLGYCNIDPSLNGWISCLPAVLLAHMEATNRPGEWVYLGYKSTYTQAERWKSEILVRYFNLLPPRTKSVLLPDFEYGFAEAKTTEGGPKHEVYVKYAPVKAAIPVIQEPDGA